MASASVAEQTTDEKIGEDKVIDHAKFVDEADVSQPKETAGGEVEPENSGASVTDSNVIIEDKKDEASAAEVKKEVEDDASGILENKRKNESGAADPDKKENVVSEASGCEILENIKGDASVVNDVKEEAETGMISSPCDAEVEAPVGNPEEKSLTNADSSSEAVDKTLVDSSLTSVQEWEQVGYQPEASEAVVQTVKITEESLDNSANPHFSSENIEKSGEPLIAPSVTEPAPDATGTPEGESDQVKYESEVSEPAVEIAKTTEKPVAPTTTEPEATGELEKESEQVDHEPEASDLEVERVKTTGESLNVYADSALAAETAATSQGHLKAITVTEPTPEIIGEPQRQEPEALDPAVETGKATGESLDASGDLALASETAATSEEHPNAIAVTEPAPETIGEPERESKQVGLEPKISVLAVETTKTTGEYLDASGDPALASETVVTSQEHLKAIAVTEPAPEIIGEPERQEPEVLDLAVETVKTTGESLDASGDPALASETAAALEEHPKAFTVTEPAPETIGEPEWESEQVGHEPEISDLAVETAKTTGESLDASGDPALVTETAVTSEERPKASTFTERAPETIGQPERESDLVGHEPEVSDPTVETLKTTGESLDVSANLAPASETVVRSEEQPTALNVTEPTPDAIGELVRESAQVDEVGVSKPIVEIAKTTGESLDTSTNPSPASETAATSEEFPEAVTVIDPSPDAIGELGRQNETSEANEVVEVSKEQNILAVEVQAASGLLKEESVVETGSSTSHVLDTVPGDSAEVNRSENVEGSHSVSESMKKGGDDVNAGGCIVETKNDESDHSATESLGKAVTVDSSLPNPSIAVGKTEARDATSTTEAAQVVVIPGENIKFAEEAKHENQNVKQDTTQAQASRDIDLGGQTDKTNTSNEEPVVKLEAEKADTANVEKDETQVVKLEEAEKSDIGDQERDETDEKKDETEKSDAQNLLESSRDSAVSKTDLEVQKAESSGKPSKTLMSKVKHSIGKVKKAIIGKSPSSKTISVESKDELKVK